MLFPHPLKIFAVYLSLCFFCTPVLAGFRISDETIERMMSALHAQGIKVKAFRADSASYQFSTITSARKYFDKIYVLVLLVN